MDGDEAAMAWTRPSPGVFGRAGAAGVRSSPSMKMDCRATWSETGMVVSIIRCCCQIFSARDYL